MGSADFVPMTNIIFCRVVRLNPRPFLYLCQSDSVIHKISHITKSGIFCARWHSNIAARILLAICDPPLKKENHPKKYQVVGVKTQSDWIVALIQYIHALQPLLEIFKDITVPAWNRSVLNPTAQPAPIHTLYFINGGKTIKIVVCICCGFW